LSLPDHKIRILLKNAATPASTPIAYSEITLPADAIFNATFPSVPLIDRSKGVDIGTISVSVAVQEGPGSYSPVSELKIRPRESTDWKTEAIQHNWRSVTHIQQNWEELALHFGWTPPRPRTFTASRGDHITIEIGFQRDRSKPSVPRPRQEVCIVPRLACSIGPQRITPYAIIQKLHLEPDFDEKRPCEYHSERGFRFPSFVLEVSPKEYEHKKVLQPSTFDAEDLDELMEVPSAPRFSIVSTVIFDFAGFRFSVPDSISAVESFEIPGIPPIVKSAAIDEIIAAGDAHMNFSLSDSTEEESA
jgi:hypothetical protein